MNENQMCTISYDTTEHTNKQTNYSETCASNINGAIHGRPNQIIDPDFTTMYLSPLPSPSQLSSPPQAFRSDWRDTTPKCGIIEDKANKRWSEDAAEFLQ